MARKRAASPWDRTGDWAERDMAGVLAALDGVYSRGEQDELPVGMDLPDGRQLGEVAWRVCQAVRDGQAGTLSDLAADAAVTIGTLMDNGYREISALDGTERHGTLGEAAAAAVRPAAPGPGMPG